MEVDGVLPRDDLLIPRRSALLLLETGMASPSCPRGGGGGREQGFKGGGGEWGTGRECLRIHRDY